MSDVEFLRAHWRQRAFQNDFNDPNAEEHYPPDLELEPIHLNIDLFIDLANAAVSGKVTNTVKARRNGPTVLKLDAVDFEDVKARDPDGNALTWHYDGSALAIHWAEAFVTG